VKVGCRIDIHKEIMVATVSQSESEYETREFSSHHKFFDKFKKVV
jgi:hypothetical protein